MGPGDVPDKVLVPKEAQVERMKDKAEDFDPLLADVTSHVLSRGQVREMRLPPGWFRGETKEREEEKPYSYEMFHPGTKNDVMLWFFYRGQKASDSAAESFREVLDKPPHVLTPAEIKSLAEVIRDKSDPDDFRMSGAHTEKINNKTVLVIDGRYIDSQEDAHTVYVDADGTGKVVQEIHYRAPKADYPRYLKEVKASFASIRWK